jgi:hypothetical protein
MIRESYWDIREQPKDYSFVDYAISRGYSIFFYDRLGSGLSSKSVSPPPPTLKTRQPSESIR